MKKINEFVVLKEDVEKKVDSFIEAIREESLDGFITLEFVKENPEKAYELFLLMFCDDVMLGTIIKTMHEYIDRTKKYKKTSGVILSLNYLNHFKEILRDKINLFCEENKSGKEGATRLAKDVKVETQES